MSSTNSKSFLAGVDAVLVNNMTQDQLDNAQMQRSQNNVRHFLLSNVLNQVLNIVDDANARVAEQEAKIDEAAQRDPDADVTPQVKQLQWAGDRLEFAENLAKGGVAEYKRITGKEFTRYARGGNSPVKRVTAAEYRKEHPKAVAAK